MTYTSGGEETETPADLKSEAASSGTPYAIFKYPAICNQKDISRKKNVPTKTRFVLNDPMKKMMTKVA